MKAQEDYAATESKHPVTAHLTKDKRDIQERLVLDRYSAWKLRQALASFVMLALIVVSSIAGVFKEAIIGCAVFLLVWVVAKSIRTLTKSRSQERDRYEAFMQKAGVEIRFGRSAAERKKR